MSACDGAKGRTRLWTSGALVAAALAMFSVARLALYAYQHDAFASLGLFATLKGFIEGVRFDLSIILTFFAAPLVMMNLPLGFAGKRGWCAAWGWTLYPLFIAAGLLLASDVLYFDYVKRHMANEMVLMKEDAWYLVEVAFSNFGPVLILLSAYFAAVFLFFRKLLSRPPAETGRAWAKFLALAIFLFLGIRGTVADKSLNIIDAFRSGSTAYGNLALNGVFSAYHSSRASRKVNHRFMEEKEAYSALGMEGRENLDYPLSVSFGAQGKGNGYNVIFFLMESWGYGYVDALSGGAMGLTPNFDSLAAKGLAFRNFYAVGQRSILGIQATLTGVPPLKGLPVIGKGLEVSRISRLGEILERNGYRTIFVQSSRKRSYRVDSIAKSMGFSEFHGMEDMPILLDYPDPSASAFGWDYETYMFLKKKLDEGKQPFFAYVFTGTTHTPYPPLPDRFLRHPHGENTEEGFYNTLYYSDWSLGEFMREAEKSGWFENTIFIFTADHAQVHWQSGDFREKFHTPLLIYAPGIIRGGRVVDTPGSQLDIMPTVMDLLGLGDEFTAMGKSLLREDGHFAMVTEGDVVGIIDEKGFLKHTLKNRLEAGPLEAGVPDGHLDTLEKKLLAADQLSYELLRSNRWAK